MPANTITLNFESGATATDAYSVTLASADSTYGIKEVSSQDVSVPSGTIVQNPSTGSYAYTFEAESGVTYVASWRIVPFEGDDPIYKTQSIEPVSSSSSVTAVADYRGTFRQGESGSLKIKITDFEGNAIDPESISVTITDQSGVIVTLYGGAEISGSVPEKVLEGYYVYDWAILTDQDPGKYIVEWTFVIDGVTNKELQEIIIAENATNTNYYSGQILLMRHSLELMIGCAQHIPVYFQQAQPSRDRQTFRWTKPQWNQTPGARIYRNKQLVTSGYEINFFRGQVKFDSPLTEFDNVFADYNFRWFSDEQLDRFLSNGTQRLNIYPPHTRYAVANIPEKYIVTVLYGAAVDAIRTLMMCINFQEPAQFFGGNDNASKVFGQLDQLKKNYEDSLKDMLEQKKLFPYVGLTKAVVAPEFTLPGGRSLTLDTKGLISIENSPIYEEVNLSDMYDIHNSGKRFSIQSQDRNGEIIFADVTKVWESGIKEVFEMITEKGRSIKSSDEHLFFANGSYMPLFDVKEGYSLICVDEKGNIIDDRVKSILSLEREELMYDLEVATTANLFANNIKCHNSRWFRMLFSGSGMAG